jgi:hypothetical protein
MQAKDIEAAIRKDFPLSYWIPQCRVGCGYGDDGERTVDLWGISVKRPYLHLSVEIKVSRSDYLRDIRQVLKQRRVRMMANQFYFGAPVGILKAADLPIWAGLIEVTEGGEAKIAVQAPWFDSSPPTWSFVASLVRRFEKAVYEPSPNVLDACAAAIDAIQRGDEREKARTIHKARVAIIEARRQVS